jgi:hypothetical protein
MLRTVKRLALVLATAAALAGGRALACDGNPPKVVNRDGEAREVVITCGSKVERLTVQASASRELRGKSGCTIRLGDSKPTKLSTEMECTISNGKITCDLL